MRIALCLFLFSLSLLAMADEYLCGEPRGVAMSSDDGHKTTSTKFSGAMPVVTVIGKEMTVVWGGGKAAEKKGETVFKTSVLHQSPELISAAALNFDRAEQNIVLFTLDVKRGFLYTSIHAESRTLQSSAATTVVSSCSKSKG